jgi:hypothetical protein
LRPDLPDELIMEMYVWDSFIFLSARFPLLFVTNALDFHIVCILMLIYTCRCRKLTDPRQLALIPYNISQWLFDSLLKPCHRSETDEDDETEPLPSYEFDCYETEDNAPSSVYIEELPDDAMVY